MTSAISLTVGARLNGSVVPVEIELDANAVSALNAALEVPPAGHASPYMTIAEAAEYVRCPRSTIDCWLSARRLGRHKVGRKTLVERAELERFIESNGRAR